MKRFTILAATLLLSLSLAAGTAEDLLRLHKSGETYTTAFTEVKNMPKAHRETTKKGNLTFRAPSYLKMDYTDPKGEYTLFDTNVFDRCRGGKVTHVPAKKGSQYDLFRSMILLSFAGDCEAIARQNEAKAVYTKKDGKILVDITTTKAHTYSLKLTYNATSGRMTEMVLIEPNGNYTTYSVIGICK